MSIQTVIGSLAFFIGASFSVNGFAHNLLWVYQRALEQDPTVREAYATYLAAKQTLPIARAELYPQLGVTANVTMDKFLNIDNNPAIHSRGFAFNLNQAILRLEKCYAVRQADFEVRAALQTFAMARQTLIVSVVEAYFGVLAAQDDLELSRAQKASLEAQLNQAQQKFKLGVIAIADLKQAQAQYQMQLADQIEKVNALEDKKLALSEIINVIPETFATLQPDFVPVPPRPANLEQWARITRRYSHAISEAKFQYLALKKAEQVQFAQHYPMVDFVGQYGGQRSDQTINLDSIVTYSGFFRYWSFALDGTLNLFSGGKITALTREAALRKIASGFEWKRVERATVSQTKQTFRGVVSDISSIKAYQQGVASALTALDAAQKGYDLGLNTTADIMDRLFNVYTQKKNLMNARYDYVLNVIRLKDSAGILSDADVVTVNNWLLEKKNDK